MASDTPERLCMIGLCAVDGVGPATVARLKRAARQLGAPLHCVAAWPADRLRRELALTAPAAAALAAAEDPLGTGRALLQRMEPLGVRVVLTGDPGYPPDLARFLGPHAPPVLFTTGDPALLRRRRVAVVGSRRPSPAAVAAARALACSLAEDGIAVVSGGADGIDMAAHTAAARAGGTLAVPAAGLARFRRRGLAAWELARAGWFCLGQFPPQSRWRTPQALIRNRTIVALSEAVVAFEPRDVGGTWHTSRWALRMGRPLFIAAGGRRDEHARAVRKLVRLGACALDLACMPTAQELARLAAEYRPPPRPDQARLFE
ncbi:MAG: hypothetical protein GXY85_10220 [Candidatus Brocadiaceae bacterium]|nr:hypothetical protein [Candidatus Brocadiaceae bacterium]